MVHTVSSVNNQIRFNSSNAETRKVVYRSLSSNIYTNLALEDWFYQNHNFEKSQILLFYRNDPCVVIGRHQNPWTEANVPFLRSTGVSLARRNSGGGTVFHDQGNINMSFLTSKAEYNRTRNLNLICDALKRVVDLDVSVNKRDDIVIDGTKKVSGTAAKIGRASAYHHCTLLVNVDTGNLHEALNNPASDIIETNATKSIRSPVENLVNKCDSVDIVEIETAIASEFSVDDIVDIYPSDLVYEGLDEIEEGYQSWSWIYGKSPKFSVSNGDYKMSISNGKAYVESQDKTYDFDSELPFHLEKTKNPKLISLASMLKKIL
eukprot:GFUD01030941.1.p1 GENE.GFUD01030941.1~~GFUD01030941.1.p1  ORF type:complete len:340 (+),score=58.14 GFUD01030941.1:62-1021(+)